MKINILSEENKTLLSRIEINAEIEFEGKTPSKEEVRKAINELDTNPNYILLEESIGSLLQLFLCQFHVLLDLSIVRIPTLGVSPAVLPNTLLYLVLRPLGDRLPAYFTR